MYRIGWLLIGLGVLLLFSHGGFGLFFPLLFLLLLWMVFFGGRRPYGYGWSGPRHGRSGYERAGCPDQSPRDQRDEPQPAAKPEERSYTGETTQL